MDHEVMEAIWGRKVANVEGKTNLSTMLTLHSSLLLEVYHRYQCMILYQEKASSMGIFQHFPMM